MSGEVLRQRRPKALVDLGIFRRNDASLVNHWYSAASRLLMPRTFRPIPTGISDRAVFASSFPKKNLSIIRVILVCLVLIVVTVMAGRAARKTDCRTNPCSVALLSPTSDAMSIYKLKAKQNSDRKSRTALPRLRRPSRGTNGSDKPKTDVLRAQLLAIPNNSRGVADETRNAPRP